MTNLKAAVNWSNFDILLLLTALGYMYIDIWLNTIHFFFNIAYK